MAREMIETKKGSPKRAPSELTSLSITSYQFGLTNSIVLLQMYLSIFAETYAPFDSMFNSLNGRLLDHGCRATMRSNLRKCGVNARFV